MSTHTARLEWELREEDDFPRRRYSRAHIISFDGGAHVLGSSSTAIVPLPWSDPAGVDPDELFVASIAECHMLWFLDLAARDGRVVNRYLDEPEGVLALNGEGQLAVTEVTLRPMVRFAGEQPSADALTGLHRRAHAECFIARSIRSEIRVEPRLS